MKQKTSDPVLALPTCRAAKAMGISRSKLWKLTQMGLIRKTPYGTYPVTEINRHLQEQAT